jgi:RimJ/RimL family protein N-acetyltransferase
MTCSTTMAAPRTAAPTTGAAGGRPVHPVPVPAPAHVHVHVRLRDGGSVLLRPLVGGEVAVLETVFEGLSTRSRRQRFLVPMPRLPSGHRRALADVDGHRHVAWVALVDGVPVGICRYLTTAPDAGELAFEVVDAHQGRGIASALVDAVTTVARARGITWMEATVEPGNLASEAVLARVGIELFLADGLLEGRGELRPAPSTLVNQRAVLALAGQEASSSSTAAATSSS